MRRSGTRGLAVAAILMAMLAGCGSDETTEPTADAGVTVGGLNFSVPGSGYSTASGALPAGEAAVPAPVVRLVGALDGSSAAQVAVSAAEPFETVLLQPVGWQNYARVVLPGPASLIAVATRRDPLSSFFSPQLQVAIIRGGRVSPPVTIRIEPTTN